MGNRLAKISLAVIAAILFFSSAVRAEAEEAYIIVHALNPEGIEVASVEGMYPHSVEIYDGDTFIGYGIAIIDELYQPITISPGEHTIRVKFNGMTLEKNITLEPYELKPLVFTFQREEFDIVSLLQNALGGSISYSWDCAFAEGQSYTYEDYFEGTGVLRAKLKVSASNVTGFANGQISVDYDVWNYASYMRTAGSPSGGYVNVNTGVIIPVALGGYPYDPCPFGPGWSGYSGNPVHISIPLRDDFENWYAQSIIEGENYPFLALIPEGWTVCEMGQCASLLSNSWPQGVVPGYLLREVPAQEYVGLYHGVFRFCFGIYGPPEGKHENGALSHLSLSSVPYDVTGTGIKYEGDEKLLIIKNARSSESKHALDDMILLASWVEDEDGAEVLDADVAAEVTRPDSSQEWIGLSALRSKAVNPNVITNYLAHYTPARGWEDKIDTPEWEEWKNGVVGRYRVVIHARKEGYISARSREFFFEVALSRLEGYVAYTTYNYDLDMNPTSIREVKFAPGITVKIKRLSDGEILEPDLITDAYGAFGRDIVEAGNYRVGAVPKMIGNVLVWYDPRDVYVPLGETIKVYFPHRLLMDKFRWMKDRAMIAYEIHEDRIDAIVETRELEGMAVSILGMPLTIVAVSTGPTGLLAYELVNMIFVDLLYEESARALRQKYDEQLDRYRYIMNEPPDPNYREIFEPRIPEPIVMPPDYDGIVTQSILDLTNELAIRVSFDEAILVAIERYRGAAEAGELPYMIAQLEALIDICDRAIDNADALMYTIEAVMTEMSIIYDGYDLTIQEFVSRLSQQGFTPEEEEGLRGLGFDDEELITYKELLMSFDFSYIFDGLDGMDSVTSGSREVYAALREGALDALSFLEDHPPLADDIAATTQEGTPVGVTVTSSDPDGDPLEHIDVTEPEHGTVALNANIATYTPEEDYLGEDSFSYRVKHGWLYSDMADVLITVNPSNNAPVVVVTANRTTGYSPLWVRFSSKGSHDPDGDTITYLWEFGDGSSSIQANPSHMYREIGEYEAKLTVKDSHGATGVETLTILVKNREPIARGWVWPRRISQGQQVYFMGFGWDRDGTVTEYRWRSSIDGFLSDKSFFTTDELSLGRHDIYFKVKDDQGAWSKEIRRTVVVREARRPFWR